jgi:hypothetical protein
VDERVSGHPGLIGMIVFVAFTTAIFSNIIVFDNFGFPFFPFFRRSNYHLPANRYP